MEEKFKVHREFYDRPILLTPEQIKNPLQVLVKYFSAILLHEIRSDLYKLSECVLLTDNTYFAEPEERASIMESLQRLEEMVEAAYLVSLKKKQSRPFLVTTNES